MAQSVISITELRKNFDEILQRVKSGEIFIITKYGKPHAQFIPAQNASKKPKTPLSQKKQDTV